MDQRSLNPPRLDLPDVVSYAIKYRPGIMNFLRNFVPQQDISDVFQESMYKIIEKKGTYDPRYRPSTWIFQIVRNCCYNLNLKRSTRERKLREISQRPPEIRKPLELDQEDLEGLYSAISTLPPHHQEVLALRFWGGLELGEVAELLGISYTCARSRSNDAIGKLRKYYGSNNP